MNIRPSGVVTLDPCLPRSPCHAFGMNEPYLRDLNIVFPLSWGNLSLDLPVRCWSVLRFLSKRQPTTFRECAKNPDGEALEVEIYSDSVGISVTRASDYRGPERPRVPRPPLRLSWAALEPLFLDSEIPTPILPDLAQEFALLSCRPVHDELDRLRLLVGAVAGIGRLQSVSEAQDAGNSGMVEELLDFDKHDMLLFSTRRLVMQLAAELPIGQLQAEYRGLYTPEAWATPFPDWLASALVTVTELCWLYTQMASESDRELRCALMARLLIQLDGFADQESLADRLCVAVPLPAGSALRS